MLDLFTAAEQEATAKPDNEIVLETETAPVVVEVEEVENRFPMIQLLNESIAPNGREIDSRAVSRFLPQDHVEAQADFITADFTDASDAFLFFSALPLSLGQALAAIWREDNMNPTNLSRSLPSPLSLLRAIAPKPWTILKVELPIHLNEWSAKNTGTYPHQNLHDALLKRRPKPAPAGSQS